jgi:hypothetical protein
MADNVLKNINCFVDGWGMAGNVSELTPPKLAIKTDEHRAGGMDAAVDIDMGMEKMEAGFTLTKYCPDTLKLFGLGDGNTVPLVFRAATQSDDGDVTPVRIVMRGMLKEVDKGTWKPGEKATLAFKMNVRYYKEEVDGEVIHEIDIDNFVRIINGVDVLADMRDALGI